MKIGWQADPKPTSGFHQKLTRPGWEDYTWAFHDSVEIGPAMLSRIAKRTGLIPDDL